MDRERYKRAIKASALERVRSIFTDYFITYTVDVLIGDKRAISSQNFNSFSIL